MLCALGDLVEDIVVWLPRDPERGGDTESRVFRRRGGSAATVAAMTASAGGAARFVGQVGDDPVGDALVAELSAGGVDTMVVQRGETGTVVVLVDAQGERTMLSDRGAATQLGGLPEGALDGIQQLHIPAYSFTTDPLAAVALKAVGDVVDRGIEVSIDASSVEVIREFGPAEFVELLQTLKPAVLFVNADEARVLGIRGREPVAGPRVTVVKNGPRPAMVIRHDGTVRSVEVPPVGRIIDSTGAGDAFAAGYLLARASQQNHKIAAQAGHLLAAQVLKSPGASLDPLEVSG